MKGSVRTKERCPVCGNPFDAILHPLTQDVIDLMCGKCRTRPRRVFVDARSIRNRKGVVGYLFRDERGILFDSFLAAARMLEAVRHDFDKDPLRFDPTRWSRIGRESHKLADVWWAWHSEISKTRSRAYYTRINHFGDRHVLPILGEVDVRELTRGQVQELETAMTGKGLSPSSRRSVLRTLKDALCYARDEKMIGVDDIPKFPAVKVPHQDRYVADEALQQHIIARMPERVRLMMQVLVATGMRPGEACGLKKRDIRDDRRIHIQRAIDAWRNERSPKNNRERYTDPLPEGLWNDLRALPVLPEAWLFVNSDGKLFTTGILSQMFKDATRAAGYPQLTLYTATRHSRASRDRREEKDRDVQERALTLGNSPKMVGGHYQQDRSMVLGLGTGVGLADKADEKA